MKRILGTAKGQKTRCRRESMLLYAVTDRTWLGDATLAEQVGAAIKGGVTFIQFREKYLDKEAFIREAKEIREVCRNYQVPFVINDHADIAAAIDADGVHVGQKDIDALDARRILGEDKIIGVTARTVEQALRAQEHGADYLGVGAVFQTDTKADAVEVKRDTVKAIYEAVDIPVIAIGGIGEDNVLQLAGNGLCGIAVVSALFARPDIEQAARNLKRLSEKMVNQ